MRRPLPAPLLSRLEELRGDDAVLLTEAGETFLLACVTASADGPAPLALAGAFSKLRARSSRTAVESLGGARGFRVEDLVHLEFEHPEGCAPEQAWRWLGRQLPHELQRVSRPAAGPLRLRGIFAERLGSAPARPTYVVGDDGRLRVEAFELHVVEHCNLRCANCCNMSPFVARQALSVAEVDQQCRQMAKVLVADVFKIMGGEPLLHPDLPGVLAAVKASGISQTVRLFTNGLLLHTMSETFWASLDQLTISNYDSAPVKPKVLLLAESKALEYGFILNTKSVSTFSQVLSPRYDADDARVERTFQQCWLRHRCLIARKGRFFMCTRAAYAPDFHARVQRDEPPPGYTYEGDGVRLDSPDLARALRDYLNGSRPLASCRYCLGGDGPVQRHHQLTPAEVRGGQLSREGGSGA